MKNIRNTILLVLLSLLIGVYVGSNFQLAPRLVKRTTSAQKKLDRFLYYLSNNYVEEVDSDSLVGVVIESIIDRLDPHSTFIPKTASQELAENMQGEFVGIGVSFFMVEDTVAVVRVLNGGPSEAAGLLPGDRIMLANNDSLFQQNYSSEEIVSKLKGPPNTEVELAIYRKQNDSVFWVNMKRGAVPLKSVDAAYMIDDATAYIKINRFSQTTYQEFAKALNALKWKKFNNLVLDLRDNPGGYLYAAVLVADTFLEADTPIVITEANNGEREETLATASGGLTEEGLYILVNEQSASASEILAGAVQDNDRGWIVGRRSFGKGLVQQQLPLGDGDAVRLTTARYFTPTGRSIQRPYGDNREAYYAEVAERFERGEMEDANKIPQNDSLSYTTPKGRTVYGGGGITPDIFVPNTNSEEEEWNRFVLRSNVINHFVFTTLDKNRAAYSFPAASSFSNTPLENTSQWLKEFKAYCEQNRIPFTFKDEAQILNAIKAYIGLQLYGEAVFTEVHNQNDPFLALVKAHSTQGTD